MTIPAIGVVSHWGFIRAMTGHEVANCAIVEFDPESGVRHLPDTGRTGLTRNWLTRNGGRAVVVRRSSVLATTPIRAHPTR